jgi:hypothetical protein
MRRKTTSARSYHSSGPLLNAGVYTPIVFETAAGQGAWSGRIGRNFGIGRDEGWTSRLAAASKGTNEDCKVEPCRASLLAGEAEPQAWPFLCWPGSLRSSFPFGIFVRS